jgi:DNA (cytosine-5)-methyltransferase 1
MREASVLQGFPLTYRFVVQHGKGAIASMIGNALPPPFIAAHAKTLVRGLLVAERTQSDGNPVSLQR